MKRQVKNRNENENAGPIQRSVQVDCAVEDAFRLFTEGFGKWWPLAPGFGSGKDGQTCEIEPWAGGRVLERSPGGLEREWGAVTVWNPPAKVELTWNPDGREDERQTVSVEFQEEMEGTKVTLTHHGWQFAGVMVAVSDAAPAPNLVRGLVVCGAPNWKPVAIGRYPSVFASSVYGVGRGMRETAWRNITRPTWAEVFVNRFAAFAAEHSTAAV